MKKTLVAVMSVALVIALAITVGAAFTPEEGWTFVDGDEAGITLTDGAYTFKDVNNAVKNAIISKAVDGGYRFEAEATAPSNNGTVDNWITVGVLGKDLGWPDTGFRFQISEQGVRIGDMTGDMAAPWLTPVATPEVKTNGEFNKIVIEVIGNEASFTVNGTYMGKFALTDTAKAGNLVSFGINYWKNSDYDFGEGIIKNITVTAIDAFTEAPVTSTPDTSSDVNASSAPAASSSSAANSSASQSSGCGNKAE